MRKLGFIFFLAFAALFAGCKGDSASSAAGLVSTDLMKYGMPIKVNAPAEAKIESSDLGIMKDVTIKGEGNYSLQISSGVSTTTNIASIKAEQLRDVQNALYFGEVVQEDEHGFIYRKKISEDRINHDFRYIKIQADQEYIFQTGLLGSYSLEDVQRMYDSVKG